VHAKKHLEAVAMDIDALKQRLADEGLHPDDDALKEMHGALPHIEAMKARVNRRFEVADEPAHIFVAEPEP
jgi:hypothetical protein